MTIYDPKHVTGVLLSYNLVKLSSNFRKFSYFFLLHLTYSHKFPTYYLIFYRNGVSQIENTDKAGIWSRDLVVSWPQGM